MNTISIIDCTLRDGGYLNNWEFNYDFQIQTIKSLIEANVDIIECGFISETTGNDEIGTNYKSIEKLNHVIKSHKLNTSSSKFAVMMKINEYNPAMLPFCNFTENTVSIIRLMIYKNELEQSVNVVKQLIEKGYEVHIQPTIISHYTDEEIVNMINLYRDLNYHSISIVDTFGALNQKEIERITILFDKYANKSARLSLHTHNNLSLAFQNAITFANTTTNYRKMYIDSTIAGLGRGAGNLPTEILISWLKNQKNKNYIVSPIKKFCSNQLQNINRNVQENDFYVFILTAQKNIHPNYAIWLLLQKYNRYEIQKIINLIPPEKYEYFDFEYIKNICETYSLTI